MATCMTPGCGKPAFRGGPGYCGKFHKNEAEAKAAAAAAALAGGYPGIAPPAQCALCPRPTDGTGKYRHCCKTCQQNGGTKHGPECENKHGAKHPVALAKSSKCALCSRPTDGTHSHCCRTCPKNGGTKHGPECEAKYGAVGLRDPFVVSNNAGPLRSAPYYDNEDDIPHKPSNSLSMSEIPNDSLVDFIDVGTRIPRAAKVVFMGVTVWMNCEHLDKSKKTFQTHLTVWNARDSRHDTVVLHEDPERFNDVGADGKPSAPILLTIANGTTVEILKRLPQEGGKRVVAKVRATGKPDAFANQANLVSQITVGGTRRRAVPFHVGDPAKNPSVESIPHGNTVGYLGTAPGSEFARVLLRTAAETRPREVFINMQHVNIAPQGLFLIRDFITEALEAEFVTAIDRLEWGSARAGRAGEGRGVKIFGPFRDKFYKIDPTKLPTPHPDVFEKKDASGNGIRKRILLKLKELCPRVMNPADRTAFDDHNTCQLVINEYLVGQELNFHYDHPTTYGAAICGISLCDAGVLTFCKENGTEAFEVFLPPRSLYLMTGDSRYKYQHGMRLGNACVLNRETMAPGLEAVSRRRVSLTWRNTR